MVPSWLVKYFKWYIKGIVNNTDNGCSLFNVTTFFKFRDNLCMSTRLHIIIKYIRLRVAFKLLRPGETIFFILPNDCTNLKKIYTYVDIIICTVMRCAFFF